jgi:hypothetical protein
MLFGLFGKKKNQRIKGLYSYIVGGSYQKPSDLVKDLKKLKVLSSEQIKQIVDKAMEDTTGYVYFFVASSKEIKDESTIGLVRSKDELFCSGCDWGRCCTPKAVRDYGRTWEEPTESMLRTLALKEGTTLVSVGNKNTFLIDLQESCTEESWKAFVQEGVAVDTDEEEEDDD